MKYSDLVEFMRIKGYTEAQLDETVEHYRFLGVVMRAGNLLQWIVQGGDDVVQEEY